MRREPDHDLRLSGGRLSARDWFEGIRRLVLYCDWIKSKADELRSQTGPKGQALESVGHGSGATDASGPILNVVQMETEYDRMRARCDMLVDSACDVLYGADGRGGLAKARCSADADCICGYYLMGMSWREVAEELADPDSKDARHWCMARAHRALAHIDEVGMATLIGTR